MRFQQRALWCLTAAALVGAAFTVAAITRQPIVANEKAVNSTDLSEMLELKLPDTLLGSERSAYYVHGTVTNTAHEAVEGPILLLVRGTGIPGLSVTNHEGTLESGEAYFTVVEKGDKLEPRRSSKTLRIRFRAHERLKFEQRKQLKLDYKLVRADIVGDELMPLDEPEEPQRRPASGLNINLGNSGNGGAGRGAADERLEPIPEEEPLPAEPQPPEEAGEGQAPKNPEANLPTDEEVARVMKIQDRATPELMAKEGVVGTATALGEDGKLAIRVYVERAGIRNNLPTEIDGIPVVTRTTGKIRPLWQLPPQGKRARARDPLPPPGSTDPDCIDNPQTFFERPVPIGVSAIHMSAGCATGTIGCRVIDANGNLFALSNNHVFANENVARVGDLILQPGPLDNDILCNVNTADSIGTLFDFEPIDFSVDGENVMDAAIAAVTADNVGKSTPCSGYGTPNVLIVPARLGMKVQKYGRTTSWRTSVVSALNVTVDVNYTAGIARFVDQIEFMDLNSPALGAPGDSGSLIVTNPGKNPVALLFAGSTLVTFGNPIDIVLERFNVTIDGDQRNDRVGVGTP